MSTITSVETNKAQAVFDSFTPTDRKYKGNTREGKFLKSLRETFDVEVGEVIVNTQARVDGEWVEDHPVRFNAFKVTTRIPETTETIVKDCWEYLSKYKPTVEVRDDDYNRVEVPNVLRWVTERIFVESKVIEDYYTSYVEGWVAFKVTSVNLDEHGIIETVWDEPVWNDHKFSLSPAGVKASFVPSVNYERLQRNAQKCLEAEVNTEVKGDWRSHIDIAIDHEVKALCVEFLRVLGKTDWEEQYPNPIDTSRWVGRNEKDAVPTVIDEIHAYAITVARYTSRPQSTGDNTVSIIGLVLRRFNEVLRHW